VVGRDLPPMFPFDPGGQFSCYKAEPLGDVVSHFPFDPGGNITGSFPHFDL